MKSRKNSTGEKLLDNFFTERHQFQSKSIAMLLSNATLSELFVKYNIAILSSTTIERLFSLGKDVLKQKDVLFLDTKAESRTKVDFNFEKTHLEMGLCHPH